MGASLAIDTDLVGTTIKLRKPRVRVEEVWWPVLPMTSWISTLMDQYPEYLLGGHAFEDQEDWGSLLVRFWSRYQQADPSHPIFDEGGNPQTLKTCIPYMLHWDEGRGLRRQAFMVQSWQTVLSHKGERFTNNSGSLV